MNAQDVMTRHPRFVGTDTSVSQAYELLHDLDVRHLPIVDAGQLVGMVSDRDLRAMSAVTADDDRALRVVEAGGRAAISDVMSGDVLYVDPETDLGEVMDLMIEHRVGAIPVVQEHTGELVGIVSYIDVLRGLRDQLE